MCTDNRTATFVDFVARVGGKKVKFDDRNPSTTIMEIFFYILLLFLSEPTLFPQKAK